MLTQKNTKKAILNYTIGRKIFVGISSERESEVVFPLLFRRSIIKLPAQGTIKKYSNYCFVYNVK